VRAGYVAIVMSARRARRRVDSRVAHRGQSGWMPVLPPAGLPGWLSSRKQFPWRVSGPDELVAASPATTHRQDANHHPLIGMPASQATSLP
jgi:hypothetical protein